MTKIENVKNVFFTSMTYVVLGSPMGAAICYPVIPMYFGLWMMCHVPITAPQACSRRSDVAAASPNASAASYCLRPLLDDGGCQY